MSIQLNRVMNLDGLITNKQTIEQKRKKKKKAPKGTKTNGPSIWAGRKEEERRDGQEK